MTYIIWMTTYQIFVKARTNILVMCDLCIWLSFASTTRDEKYVVVCGYSEIFNFISKILRCIFLLIYIECIGQKYK